MIKEHTCYSVVCDRCGKDCQEESGEYVGWNDKDYALEEANDHCDWLTYGFFHYCPDCWIWDGEDDRIPKPGIVIHIKDTV